MIRRLPIIRSAAKIGDIIYAISNRTNSHISFEFRSALSAMTEGRGVYLTDSGVSALYIILKALSKLSDRKEVVLSAYTAGSLIVAIRKAGLKPVLCDISLDDFNASYEEMKAAVSDRTLAVLAIHMFGIGMRGMERLRAELPEEVFLIEDCCQAMGAICQDRRVGESGDIGFFSFNRGKNMPICGGGFIDTRDIRIRDAIENEVKGLAVPSLGAELVMIFKVLGFSIATNPYVYGSLYSLASRFRESAPSGEINTSSMNNFQAALGMRLIDRLVAMDRRRYENGTFLLDSLKNVSGLVLPKIPADDRPAYNRLPIIFKDLEKRLIAEERLKNSGVESSRMYVRPLHHMFDLGYEKSAFPNATYLAERLLTLPVYPALKRRDLNAIAAAIKGAFQ